ncbi:MAG: hypothetical protein WDM96_08065 [Lacunisphaera sp.]
MRELDGDGADKARFDPELARLDGGDPALDQGAVDEFHLIRRRRGGEEETGEEGKKEAIHCPVTGARNFAAATRIFLRARFLAQDQSVGHFQLRIRLVK